MTAAAPAWARLHDVGLSQNMTTRGNQDDWLLIPSSAWVDSNAIAAVPEPANQSLRLGGLALLGGGAAARRRARA